MSFVVLFSFNRLRERRRTNIQTRLAPSKNLNYAANFIIIYYEEKKEEKVYTRVGVTFVAINFRYHPYFQNPTVKRLNHEPTFLIIWLFE